LLIAYGIIKTNRSISVSNIPRSAHYKIPTDAQIYMLFNHSRKHSYSRIYWQL